MKKIFDTPEIELLFFDEADVISMSGNSDPGNGSNGDPRVMDAADASKSGTSVHVTDVNTSGMDWAPTN